VDPDGKPYTLRMLEDAFLAAKRAAGITRRFRFHDLRDTFASDLTTAGVPDAWIQKALGHADAKTLERYRKPREEGLRGIADALDRRENQVASQFETNSDLNSTTHPSRVSR
jgi:integrase